MELEIDKFINGCFMDTFYLLTGGVCTMTLQSLFGINETKLAWIVVCFLKELYILCVMIRCMTLRNPDHQVHLTHHNHILNDLITFHLF